MRFSKSQTLNLIQDLVATKNAAEWPPNIVSFYYNHHYHSMRPLILFLFLGPSLIFAQKEQKMSFYFDKGSDKLSSNQEKKIASIQKKPYWTNCWLILHGFTDVDGTNNSNTDLAKRRVKTVYDLIGGDAFMKTEEHYHGEDSTTHVSDSLNRRVDIIIQRYDDF